MQEGVRKAGVLVAIDPMPGQAVRGKAGDGHFGLEDGQETDAEDHSD